MKYLKKKFIKYLDLVSVNLNIFRLLVITVIIIEIEYLEFVEDILENDDVSNIESIEDIIDYSNHQFFKKIFKK